MIRLLLIIVLKIKYFVFFVLRFIYPGIYLSSKAFDTINHGILRLKLRAIDFSNDIARCFKSYRLDLTILASTESRCSSFLHVSNGVLQGSLIYRYVNDI